jgi:hypothetical protein
MSLFLAWLALLVPFAVAAWSVAAFILRRGPTGRFLAAVVVPAVAIGCFLYADYWAKRVPPAEPGWDIFNALACLVAAGATGIVTFPVWLIAERFLRRRAN